MTAIHTVTRALQRARHSSCGDNFLELQQPEEALKISGKKPKLPWAGGRVVHQSVGGGLVQYISQSAVVLSSINSQSVLWMQPRPITVLDFASGERSRHASSRPTSPRTSAARRTF
jgi:hypothetical protein